MCGPHKCPIIETKRIELSLTLNRLKRHGKQMKKNSYSSDLRKIYVSLLARVSTSQSVGGKHWEAHIHDGLRS